MPKSPAIVTGASAGIGRALALEFARLGHPVGLVARREAELRELAAEIAATYPGVPAAVAPAEVADREQVQAAFAALKACLGPAGVVVANAGIGSSNPLGDLNVAEAERLLKVNLFGVIYAAEAALPDMLAAGAGRVVAISSLAAYKGLPGAAAYCASKAAVSAYFESLRIQYGPTGVKFQVVCPGFIRTAMTANNRSMMFALDAAPAARKIARAILGGRKVYNFPWATYRLTRLARWAPDFLVNRWAS